MREIKAQVPVYFSTQLVTVYKLRKKKKKKEELKRRVCVSINITNSNENIPSKVNLSKRRRS